jgi:hypothetical protein
VAAAKIPGLPVAFIGAGGVLIYSGIENQPLGTLLRTLAKGQTPVPGPPEQFAAAAGSTAAVPGAAAGAAAGAGDTGAHSATAAANQAIARVLAAPYGWSTGQQWADLVSLWNQESGWRSDAQNPSSTAYGIAQFLDTTWASYGPKTPDPVLQMKYGLEYIRDRYGSPSAAWAHEAADNWY